MSDLDSLRKQWRCLFDGDLNETTALRQAIASFDASESLRKALIDDLQDGTCPLLTQGQKCLSLPLPSTSHSYTSENIASAMRALEAWRLVILLLGPAFVSHPRLGQSLLDIIKLGFSHHHHPTVKAKAFESWSTMSEALSSDPTCLHKASRYRLLMQPIRHSLLYDPSVQVEALTSWRRITLQALPLPLPPSLQTASALERYPQLDTERLGLLLPIEALKEFTLPLVRVALGLDTKRMPANSSLTPSNFPYEALPIVLDTLSHLNIFSHFDPLLELVEEIVAWLSSAAEGNVTKSPMPGGGSFDEQEQISWSSLLTSLFTPLIQRRKQEGDADHIGTRIERLLALFESLSTTRGGRLSTGAHLPSISCLARVATRALALASQQWKQGGESKEKEEVGRAYPIRALVWPLFQTLLESNLGSLHTAPSGDGRPTTSTYFPLSISPWEEIMRSWVSVDVEELRSSQFWSSGIDEILISAGPSLDALPRILTLVQASANVHGASHQAKCKVWIKASISARSICTPQEMRRAAYSSSSTTSTSSVKRLAASSIADILAIGAKAMVSLLEGGGDEEVAAESEEEWLRLFQEFDIAAKSSWHSPELRTLSLGQIPRCLFALLFPHSKATATNEGEDRQLNLPSLSAVTLAAVSRLCAEVCKWIKAEAEDGPPLQSPSTLITPCRTTPPYPSLPHSPPPLSLLRSPLALRQAPSPSPLHSRPHDVAVKDRLPSLTPPSPSPLSSKMTSNDNPALVSTPTATLAKPLGYCFRLSSFLLSTSIDLVKSNETSSSPAPQTLQHLLSTLFHSLKCNLSLFPLLRTSPSSVDPDLIARMINELLPSLLSPLDTPPSLLSSPRPPPPSPATFPPDTITNLEESVSLTIIPLVIECWRGYLEGVKSSQTTSATLESVSSCLTSALRSPHVALKAPAIQFAESILKISKGSSPLSLPISVQHAIDDMSQPMDLSQGHEMGGGMIMMGWMKRAPPPAAVAKDKGLPPAPPLVVPTESKPKVCSHPTIDLGQRPGKVYSHPAIDLGQKPGKGEMKKKRSHSLMESQTEYVTIVAPLRTEVDEPRRQKKRAVGLNTYTALDASQGGFVGQMGSLSSMDEDEEEEDEEKSEERKEEETKEEKGEEKKKKEEEERLPDEAPPPPPPLREEMEAEAPEEDKAAAAPPPLPPPLPPPPLATTCAADAVQICVSQDHLDLDNTQSVIDRIKLGQVAMRHRAARDKGLITKQPSTPYPRYPPPSKEMDTLPIEPSVPVPLPSLAVQAEKKPALFEKLVQALSSPDEDLDWVAELDKAQLLDAQSRLLLMATKVNQELVKREQRDLQMNQSR